MHATNNKSIFKQVIVAKIRREIKRIEEIKMILYDYVSEDLYLEPLSQEHAEMIHIFASKYNVKKYIGWQLKETPSETEEFVKMLITRHESGSHVYASVVEKITGRVIGTVMLFNFDKRANHGEIGYVLDDTVWGKGYGTQIVRMVSEYAFKEMGLRKIFARVVNTNLGSSRILEKNGYMLEAELKDYYMIDDCLMNCMYYSRYADKNK
jgi:ribosomal-protein-alanine N-acetyltransferase